MWEIIKRHKIYLLYVFSNTYLTIFPFCQLNETLAPGLAQGLSQASGFVYSMGFCTEGANYPLSFIYKYKWKRPLPRERLRGAMD